MAPRPEPDGPAAVVLGANYRALGVVRSLGRHGIHVAVIRTDDHVLALLSRYANRRAFGRPARPGTLDDLLTGSLDGFNGAVLIPTDEDDAKVIAQRREELARRFLPTVPDLPGLMWACDKRELHRLADRIGVARPRTWLPAGPEDLDRMDPPFPVIVKPAYRPRSIATTSPKAWRADDRAALRAHYRHAARLMPADHVMIQELIPGSGDGQLSYGALAQDGRVVASIAARRTRQRPMDFGQASTMVETIPEAEVEQPAQRLLAATGYTGLVEVEFKRSGRDGLLRLLDVNPRTWGWMSIGARAGVDLPYLLWRMVSGRPVSRVRAQPGIRWVRMAMDLPTAMAEIAGGRLRTRDYVRSLRPPIDPAIAAWDDPVPGLVELPMLAALGLGRAARRARGAGGG